MEIEDRYYWLLEILLKDDNFRKSYASHIAMKKYNSTDENLSPTTCRILKDNNFIQSDSKISNARVQSFGCSTVTIRIEFQEENNYSWNCSLSLDTDISNDDELLFRDLTNPFFGYQFLGETYEQIARKKELYNYIKSQTCRHSDEHKFFTLYELVGEEYTIMDLRKKYIINEDTLFDHFKRLPLYEVMEELRYKPGVGIEFYKPMMEEFGNSVETEQKLRESYRKMQ